MKFQIPNMHHSEVNGRTHTQTDRQTDKPKAICPSNFFKVGGIKKQLYLMSSSPVSSPKKKPPKCQYLRIEVWGNL